MSDELSNKKSIEMFIHCRLCVDELTSGVVDSDNPVAPSDYQRLEIGWTVKGLQIRCKRHDVNVFHIDFGGAKLLANTTRARLPNERGPAVE
jgi:hypothetical protein